MGVIIILYWLALVVVFVSGVFLVKQNGFDGVMRLGLSIWSLLVIGQILMVYHIGFPI